MSYNLCTHQICNNHSDCIDTDIKNITDSGYPRILVAGKERTVTCLIGSIKNDFKLISANGDLQGCHGRDCKLKPRCIAFDHIHCDSRVNNCRDRISEEKKLQMSLVWEAIKNGDNKRDIMKKFDVSGGTIHDMITGRTHNNITGLDKTRKQRPRKSDLSQTLNEVTTKRNVVCKKHIRAMETINSVNNLSMHERAEKYNVSTSFLTELDKALLFKQTNTKRKFQDVSNDGIQFNDTEQKICKKSKAR